ncbi:exonuclease domain-containing protein [Ancylobacter terrae]|uniref:exonuclease domain-containing protein n=1 Tax=Ancylobacter sp. sgz301288 TaxID=3342077 RepID=UPI00385B9B1F
MVGRAAPGLALTLWLAAGVALAWLLASPAERGTMTMLAGGFADRTAVFVAWWLGGLTLAAIAGRRFHELCAAAPRRLADATRVLAESAEAPDLAPEGPPPLRALAEAINALAHRRRTLQRDVAHEIARASRATAQQRDQLATLMAELQQSVVVCNPDGRIMLYNERARALCRRLSRAPGVTGGAELVGLGRSIHALIDPALINHARESVERSAVRGTRSASARFVTTTPAGHLLRVGLAPVRPEGSPTAGASGFVLMLDDITEEQETHARFDRRLRELVEAGRASLAALQAALDLLDYPDLAPPDRDRFRGIVREEAGALGERLAAMADAAAQGTEQRWPLQDMLGQDLVAAIVRRIADRTGLQIAAAGVDTGLWLSVDSYALVEALAFLAQCLGNAGVTDALSLRLAPTGRRAHLDLAWRSPADSGVLAAATSRPMQSDTTRSALTVRDIAERHSGEVWLEHDRAGGSSFFRFLLPLAADAEQELLNTSSRPEFYDFDLFSTGEGMVGLSERPLGDIAYTVFDTETTGLDPTGGDEIIQIGAVRIVNGRLLRGECFDQLVDPRRPIPEASTAVHGIRAEMVRGQPLMLDVLPAFHAFADDTVLVGHNVAFDMRFLTLKADATGIRFDQPILDTLLLASLVHPHEANHGLEATAARLGIEVAGRHSALGDALVTAELFLRLLPLLQQRGIRTLGEARAAAEQSYYARLRY